VSAPLHDGPADGSLSVLLAGGGTAGHVSPMLALADALVRRDPGTRITALGTAEGLEARLVPQRGYELVTVAKVPLPRRLGADLLRVPARLKGAVDAAATAIRDAGADVVVGMGGYVSPPAYLAARRLGVPIVVHEQNTRPGIANRLGARLTRFVAVTFEGTRLPHAVRLGMPLRREISRLDRDGLRAEARAHFGLAPDAPTLLVTGGSLGAQRLNESVREAGADLLAAGAGVLHLTGAGKGVDVPVAADGARGRYVVREFSDRMDLAYAAADLVLCRAGASTVCEITTVGLPAVYVPLPIGNGEQRLNAQPVVDAGGGLLVDNGDLTAQWLRDTVVPLLADPARLASMAGAARGTAVLDADERLVDLVHEAAASRAGGR
jgi:UDP-N-acetylglucosamine--N-acetylmuramyl-(pentapeptide) pyrophosphoryl-undecaprenol N-acetylglucosamine transferase